MEELEAIKARVLDTLKYTMMQLLLKSEYEILTSGMKLQAKN